MAMNGPPAEPNRIETAAVCFDGPAPWWRQVGPTVLVARPNLNLNWLENSTVPPDWRRLDRGPAVLDLLVSQVRYCDKAVVGMNPLLNKDGEPGDNVWVCGPGVADSLVAGWPAARPGTEVPHVPAIVLRARPVVLGVSFKKLQNTPASMIIDAARLRLKRSLQAAGRQKLDTITKALTGREVSWPNLHETVPVTLLFQDVQVRGLSFGIRVDYVNHAGNFHSEILPDPGTIDLTTGPCQACDLKPEHQLALHELLVRNGCEGYGPDLTDRGPPVERTAPSHVFSKLLEQPEP